MTARVVIDTNVLAAAAWAARSASRRVAEAARAGAVRPLTSAALWREYDHILARPERVRAYFDGLRDALAAGERFEPAGTPRVVPGDPADDKLLALATAGLADAVVTSDAAVLSLDPYGTVRVLTPGRFLELWPV